MSIWLAFFCINIYLAQKIFFELKEWKKYIIFKKIVLLALPNKLEVSWEYITLFSSIYKINNIAKNEKFQHLKMYPNKILSKRTTATAWFYIIICFAWSFGCANNIIGFPGTNAFRCIVSEIRKKVTFLYYFARVFTGLWDI